MEAIRGSNAKDAGKNVLYWGDNLEILRERGKGQRPSVCPKCKSPNWDRPRQFERRKAS